MKSVEEISKMIEEDSAIDQTDLSSESLKISKLQSKWIRILAEMSLEIRDLQVQFNLMQQRRSLYYTGKLPDEVYKEEPLQIRVLKQDLPNFLKSDPKLLKLETQLHTATICVNMVEHFMKDLSQRSFNIKNAIDYQKFRAGL